MGRMSSVQLIDQALLTATIERARGSARQRTNHNFHSGPLDNPHRFLNAWIRGTYAAPHRHQAPPKAESFIVLHGQVAVFVFDDLGAVIARHVLGRDLLGIDLAPGVWHTLAPLSEVAVCFEVKPGPYDLATDKEFAPWAPAEGSPEAPAYLGRLLADIPA
jgi:cupin fold WbuC family metalloprotein